MVPPGRLELPLPKKPDFESGASTSSATGALVAPIGFLYLSLLLMSILFLYDVLFYNREISYFVSKYFFISFLLM